MQIIIERTPRVDEILTVRNPFALEDLARQLERETIEVKKILGQIALLWPGHAGIDPEQVTTLNLLALIKDGVEFSRKGTVSPIDLDKTTLATLQEIVEALGLRDGDDFHNRTCNFWLHRVLATLKKMPPGVYQTYQASDMPITEKIDEIFVLVAERSYQKIVQPGAFSLEEKLTEIKAAYDLETKKTAELPTGPALDPGHFELDRENVIQCFKRIIEIANQYEGDIPIRALSATMCIMKTPTVTR